MEGKPIHYDGSIQNTDVSNSDSLKEPFKISDEMRVNLSGNPFISTETE